MNYVMNQQRLVQILNCMRDDPLNPYVTPFFACTTPIAGEVSYLMNRRVTPTDFACALELLGYQRVLGNKPNISSIFGAKAIHACDKTLLFARTDCMHLQQDRTPLEFLRILMDMTHERNTE